MFSCFFFFSSRRRHTRLQGDWSSDVCSSDLVTVVGTSGGATPEVIGDAGVVVPGDDPLALSAALRRLAAADQRRPLAQAGRARAVRPFSGDRVGGGGPGFWGGATF